MSVDVLTNASGNSSIAELKVMVESHGRQLKASSELKDKSSKKIATEFSHQPLLSLRANLSTDEITKKPRINLTLENIGNVKFKEIRAEVSKGKNTAVDRVFEHNMSQQDSKALSRSSLDNGTGNWTGELDPGKTKEIVYDINLTNITSGEDIRVPAVISGHGSGLFWIYLFFIISIETLCYFRPYLSACDYYYQTIQDKNAAILGVLGALP